MFSGGGLRMSMHEVWFVKMRIKIVCAHLEGDAAFGLDFIDTNADVITLRPHALATEATKDHAITSFMQALVSLILD